MLMKTNSLIICVFLFVLTNISYSQFVQTQNLIPSRTDKNKVEIGDVKFKGNQTFSDDELNSVILTKPTNRSVPHKILQNYYEQFRQNRSTLKVLNNSLKEAITSLENEITFWDITKPEIDTIRLSEYYNQHGFHFAKINFDFKADYREDQNVLIYKIIESKRYSVRSIVYLGLDSIENEILPKIEQLKNIKPGTFYNETAVIQELSNIYKLLKDEGYYYASAEMPIVSIDTSSVSDSITVIFHPGIRQTIASITIVDSLKSQSPVGVQMKNEQLVIKEGDYYSASNVDKSINNLISLGTFDLVTIDTSSVFKPITDSTLSFIVFNQYRKQQEYGVSTFLNRTTVGNYLNLGVEASYFHRNIFGAAQSIKPFASFVLNDLSSAINNLQNAEYEFQFGLNFAQPLLETWDNARIGLSFQFLYSIRTRNEVLQIKTISLPLKFPVQFSSRTYFNNMTVDFYFEHQKPENLNDAIKRAWAQAVTHNDTMFVLEILRTYSNLDEFISKEKPWLTTSLLGVSFIGDTRDNYFSPSKGHFTALAIDGFNPITSEIAKLSGMAKFFRLQMTNYWFWGVSDNSVIALKQREGFIYWWDKGNSFIPDERTFYAGGANSVRGWASRRLRYDSKYMQVQNMQSYLSEFVEDFVGSAALIEGSLEWRFRFPYMTGLSQMIAEQMHNVGITTFIDWGNAFNWLIVDSLGNYQYSMKWHEYITGLAVAVGAGLRYETPVGPFRIDFALPLYDPMNDTKLAFKQSHWFSNFKFHIGLGHAF